MHGCGRGGLEVCDYNLIITRPNEPKFSSTPYSSSCCLNIHRINYFAFAISSFNLIKLFVAERRLACDVRCDNGEIFSESFIRKPTIEGYGKFHCCKKLFAFS